MRYLHIRLESYIGIYNGMGKEVIDIDLSNSNNKIILLSGKNGSGKTTILNSINLLPDGSESFIEGKAASKYLKLTDGANIYEVTFSHPVDKNGNRCVTKVSLLKNGIEMNPNGNVGSYKDIIFNEFDIDGNFLSLSKVSSDNRGLADKKPAERKKIMSSLIASLDTYNEIYKNLNKKANVFKSYVNTIGNKISSAGDESLLLDTKASLEAKELALNNTITASRDKVVEFKTVLSMNDKDGSLKARYDELESNLKIAEEKCNQSYRELVRIKDNNSEFNFDKTNEEIEKYSKLLNQHTSDIEKDISEMNAILINVNSVNSDIDRLDIRIEKLSGEVDNDLEKTIKEYKSKMVDIQYSISKLEIKDINSITSEEINKAIDIFEQIALAVDSVYEQTSLDDLKKLENDVDTQYEKFVAVESKLKDTMAELTIKKNNMEHDKEIVSVLENRPKSCKDDSCVFVKAALDIAESYGGTKKLLKDYDDVSKHLSGVTTELENLQNIIMPDYRRLISINNIIKGIFNLVNENGILLSKFYKARNLSDTKHMYYLICDQEYRFNEFRDLSKYRNLSNDIIEYKSLDEIVSKLEVKYEIQKNSMNQLNEYIAERDEKIITRDNYKKEYDAKKNDKVFLEGMIDTINRNLSILTQYQTKFDEWNNSKIELDTMKKESDTIKESFKSSLDILNSISELEELIRNSTEELTPIIEQKNNIDAQLVLISSYKTEYEMYKEKFDFVSKLRNYSSPTSGSIQSLFMSIYMDKTLVMVNQLLGMLFGGEYQILQYVINEDEFRIPFLGNGMTVDDISSGSTSQVCMMGMIINLVLANMCSTKYNIVSLDEIDGGLDNQNKYMFIEVLNKISDILNIDQIFVISHSIESSLVNTDVILTSKSQDYADLFADSNILYQPN